MDGLLDCIDNHAHITFADILAVNLLDEPGTVHGVKVVALEHHDDGSLGIHQVQVLGIELCLEGVAAHVGQGVHDGLLAGDVVALPVSGNELAENQVIATQLECAVNGVAAIVAIHLVATCKVEVEISPLDSIDLLLAHRHDIPLAIELFGGVGDSDLTHGLLRIGRSVLDGHGFLLVFLVFLLVGMHCGWSHQDAH